MKVPPYLTKGDTVAIICMAGKVRPNGVEAAVKILKRWGLKVIVGKTIGAEDGVFGGTDQQRKEEFQCFLNDPTIKAIISARGGYGSTRYLDDLDFSFFEKHPKWIVGFSDITAVITKINNLNIQAIHGPMAKMFEVTAAQKSVKQLKKVLFGEHLTFDVKRNKYNKSGKAEGVLKGGNLCILAHCIGSDSEIDTNNTILFIEDVGEYYYNIDRMLLQLKRAGKLQKLKGLVVGQFTDCKDSDNPFGKNIEEIILDQCGSYGYPIAFGFPAGHESDNQPIIMGGKVKLVVENTHTNLIFESK